MIKDILEAAGPVGDAWKVAARFHVPNGWIAGRGAHGAEPVAPRDALDRRDQVAEAARHLHGDYVA